MLSEKVISSSDYVKHHLHHYQVSLGKTSFWTLNLDTLITSVVIGIVFLTIMFLVSKKATSGIPGSLQNFIEIFCEWVDDIVSTTYYKSRNFITPFAITIFTWILLMNLMDLLPVDLSSWIINGMCSSCDTSFRLVPTTDPNLTFALSISVFFLIIFYNLKSKGLFSFIKEIFLKPFGIFLFPVNVFLRLVDELVKPLSLSLRLYGNLFAGELIFILIALLPLAFQCIFGGIWAIFHILVVFIQAFVFMMLTVAYLNLAQDSH